MQADYDNFNHHAMKKAQLEVAWTSAKEIANLQDLLAVTRHVASKYGHVSSEEIG